ncbi:MAG: hypothetical protein ACJ8FY_26215 [Gemmataceae bacterium]
MRVLANQFVLALALAVAWSVLGIANCAQAGYMPVGSEPTTAGPESPLNAGKALPNKGESLAEQPGAGRPAPAERHEESPKPQLKDLPENPFARLNGSPGGCSSGSTVPSGSAGQPVTANFNQPVLSPVMVCWLVEANTVFSPSPIAEGLFHPPRF